MPGLGAIPGRAFFDSCTQKPVRKKTDFYVKASVRHRHTGGTTWQTHKS